MLPVASAPIFFANVPSGFAVFDKKKVCTNRHRLFFNIFYDAVTLVTLPVLPVMISDSVRYIQIF